MLVRLLALWIVSLGFVVGCNQGPARIAAPDWDPDSFADAVITKLDASGDGSLEKSELAAAPALAWGAKSLDADKSGAVSREELVARFAEYEKMQLGFTSKSIQLVYQQRPLDGAKVELVPEFFLVDVIEPASGETFPDGTVAVQVEGAEVPGLRPGYYRVVVQSPTAKLPAKYASADSTPLGVEVAPFDDDPAMYGTVQLVLQD